MNYPKLKNRISWMFLILCFSCQDAKIEKLPISMDEFLIQEGFEIELVAAEPLIYSPVTMTFDDRGRIWAVEMTGYMRDIEGKEEEKPDGKIVILEDQNGDGEMDHRKVFLDSLVLPRALAFANGGLLYAESPNLFWVSIENDVAGEKVIVDSMYTYGGNIEHMPNGLMYNLDNWLYNAKSAARYRYKDHTWLKEATVHRGQWGISHDEMGRLIYNSNSSPLNGDYVLPNILTENPYHKSIYGYNKKISEDRTFFPIQATTINRGYQKGNLDSTGKAHKFTSACGPLLYLGDQLPADFYGNAFVCGPEANLVKRYILKEEKGRVTADFAYEQEEFLVSKDETFRPVNLFTGPDGALYIVDLRKGVIQHRAYMSSYYQEELIKKGLDRLPPRGRIYRVKAKDQARQNLPDLMNLTDAEWVALLQHTNSWYRDRAQRYLVEKIEPKLTGEIETIALEEQSPRGQLHALWTLEGMDQLTLSLIEQVSRKTDKPKVMSTLVLLSESFSQEKEQQDLVEKIYTKASSLHSDLVNLQLCHSLGSRSEEFASNIWWQLAKKYKNDPLFSEALISGIRGKELDIRKELLVKNSRDSLRSMVERSMVNLAKEADQSPQLPKKIRIDGRTMAMGLYNQYCGTCHGLNGKGIENLAPPLVNSEYVRDAKKLMLIALNGLEGPITVNGKEYLMNAVMPGVRNFPELDDYKLSRLLGYVRNAFIQDGKGKLNPEEVARIRKETADRKTLLTAEELEVFAPQ